MVAALWETSAMNMSKETVITLDDGDCVVVVYGRRRVTINGGLVSSAKNAEGKLRTEPQMWLVTTDKLLVEFGDEVFKDEARSGISAIEPDSSEGIISMQVVAND